MVPKFILITVICITLFTPSINLQTVQSKGQGEVSFNKYFRYNDIQAYLNVLNSSNKSFIEVEHYGDSVEKRHLTYIKISTKKKKKHWSIVGESSKPLIFIDAGIHAREWITTALALYIIHELVENPENVGMIADIDWLIVPLVNPDGYEYAHTTDRFWRKNRSRGGRGVDLNRNFDFQWLTAGASNDEKSINYAGRRPFSEPESLALSKLILKNAKDIKLYLNLHSPFQAILYPWGYTNGLPTNNNELYRIASHMAHAISQVNSTHYKVGSFANILYLGSGTCIDWVYGVANISLAFSIELHGPEDRMFERRFIIPGNQILRVVSEAFEGIKLLPYHVRKFSSLFVNLKKRFLK